MKIIIAGATGYTATELIRQSLRRPDVTSVIALARNPTVVPASIDRDSADAAKLTSIIVKDYEGPYDADDDVKKALAGADACIWTVAITPSKSAAYPFEEVRRICQTSTLAGLRAMHNAGPNKPFRFMYMSGINAERDQTKSPRFKPEYSLMRAFQGETENQVLAYAAEHKDVEAIIVKPGLITSGRVLQDWVMAPLVGIVAGVPSIPLTVLASAMLDQVLKGAATDTLLHHDMAKLGKEIVEREAK